MAKDFLEKNLEDIIFETDNDKLCDRGLEVSGVKKRQLRIGNYGIADLVTFEKFTDFDYKDRLSSHLNITIYELKQQKIDANTLMQAYRYRKGIERYLKFRNKKFMVNIDIVLVGKTVCEGDFCYMQQYISDTSIYTYKYDFDGISFESVASYFLIKEGVLNG